jgi:opacity protein-like surface antigen
LKRNLILTVIISCFMVLLVGSSVLAGSFYVDYMQGEWDIEDENDDAPAAIIGLEQNFDRFKLGLEYTDSKWKKWDPTMDYDYTGFDAKIGYQLTEQIAFMIGYHRYDLKPENNKTALFGGGYTETFYFADIKIDGITFGVDIDFPITDKITINSSFGFSPDGDYKGDYSTEAEVEEGEEDFSIDIDIIIAKIKFDFAITDNLALSLGYHYTQYKFDEGHIDFSGPTAGLTYRFSGSSYISDKTVENKDAGTKTLVLKNDFHDTEYALTVNHVGAVKVGGVINLTAEQVKEIKKTLCGDYPSFYDGELGVRETAWHKLGNKEVRLKELVMYDSNKQIVGASLTITEVR